MEQTAHEREGAEPHPRSAGARIAGSLSTVLAAVLALAVVATGGLLLAGYRPATERSGSMQPLLHRGDVLVSQATTAGQVHVGDVITFADPFYKGVLLTHRVRAERRLPGGRIAFVTRGDANRAPERWTIAAGGQVTRLGYHLPWVGLPLIAIDSHPLYLAIGIAAALWLVVMGSVWGRGGRREEDVTRRPRRRRTRSVLGGSAMLVAALTGTALAARAEQAGPPVAALAVNDGGTPMFTLAHMAPGDTRTACERVTNNGPGLADVGVYGASSGTGLASFLTLRVERGTLPAGTQATSCAGFTPDTADLAGNGPGVLYTGMLRGFATDADHALVDPQPGWSVDHSVAYRMTVALTDNQAAQGLTAVERFVFGSNGTSPLAPKLTHGIRLKTDTATRRGKLLLTIGTYGSGRARITVATYLVPRKKPVAGSARKLVTLGQKRLVTTGVLSMRVSVSPRRWALHLLRTHPGSYRVRLTVTYRYEGAKPLKVRRWISRQSLAALTQQG